MKQKFIDAYMDTARRFAEISPAIRMKVGAIVVKDDRIISIGYNGMPVGWDNECENKEYMKADAGGWLNPDEIYETWPYSEEVEKTTADGETYKYNARYKLVTKDEVLHAESNAIAKLAKSNDSGMGADLFITHSPCIHCAKLIHQSGIKRVWFGEHYRDDAGITFLEKSGVTVEHYQRTKS
jgi:dCMP deaminase